MDIRCLKNPMARPLRIEYPGAYYHVMNRGNRREHIFLTDKNRRVFLDAWPDSCEMESKLDSLAVSVQTTLHCGVSCKEVASITDEHRLLHLVGQAQSAHMVNIPQDRA